MRHLQRSTQQRLLHIAVATVLGTSAAHATTITIINNDGPNEGFNDTTPTAPIGGNAGTTRGAQRLNVFNRAAQIWASILPSNVEIRVQAKFDALTCSATAGVLGAAGALSADMNFTNAPLADTWYHIALANKLAGTDLDPAANDISATFNSALDDDPVCLGGADWYYGFDGNEGLNVDLLPVVLHELAHGLGFSTFTTLSNGTFLGGAPDAFSHFILDTSSNKHWDEMTSAERIASAVNTNHVVWDGSSTTAAAPHLLGPRPIITVTAPASIAGTYVAGLASFGPQSFSLTGNVAIVTDDTAPTGDGCSTIVNTVIGKIALIDRGLCTFVVKAQEAQAAGAVGVIIVNNVSGATPPGLGGTDPTITIPVMSMTQADGATVRASASSTTVTLTMGFDPNQRAGADANNRVLLYAPNPLQSGSSISHWDVSCIPNMLMEPAINRDLIAANVDLTRSHFEDIGWTPATPVAIEDLQALVNDQGVTLHWRAVDADFTDFDVMRAEMHPGLGEYERRNAGTRLQGRGSMTWTDAQVTAGATYAYRLVGRLANGSSVVAGPIVVTVDAPRSLEFAVGPIPLRSETTLRYALPRAGAIHVDVYDLSGRRVRAVRHEAQAAGVHTIRWDGRDDAGHRVANGVYVARLSTNAGTVTRRIAVLR